MEMPEILPLDKHLETWARKSGQASPIRIPGLDRKRLMQLFGEWGLTKGAEIGVDGGTFSQHMFTAIPGLELIGVDPWIRDRRKQRQADGFLEGKAWTKMHMTSEEAAPQIPDWSLDFVFIDGNHKFDFVMLDLILWGRKVRQGGVIAGHDYYRFREGGVVPAVDVYAHQHGIRHWFLTDEKTATFFWIKR